MPPGWPAGRPGRVAVWAALLALLGWGGPPGAAGANLVYKADTVQSTHGISARGDVRAGGDCRCGPDSVNELASMFLPAEGVLSVVPGSPAGAGAPGGAAFGSIQEAWDYLSQRVMRGPLTISVSGCPLAAAGTVWLRGRVAHPVRLEFEEGCELVSGSAGPALVVEGPQIILASNLTIANSHPGLGTAGVVVRGPTSSLSLVSPDRPGRLEPLGQLERGEDLQDQHAHVVLTVRSDQFAAGVAVTSQARLNTFDGLVRCFGPSALAGVRCVDVRMHGVVEHLRVESLAGTTLVESSEGSVVHIHQIEEPLTSGTQLFADSGSIITNTGSPTSQLSTAVVTGHSYVSLEGVSMQTAAVIAGSYLQLAGGTFSGDLSVATAGTAVSSCAVSGKISADSFGRAIQTVAFTGSGVSSTNGGDMMFSENVATTDDPAVPPLTIMMSRVILLKPFVAAGHTQPVKVLASTLLALEGWTSSMAPQPPPGVIAFELALSTFAARVAVSITGDQGTSAFFVEGSTFTLAGDLTVTTPTATSLNIDMLADSSVFARILTLNGGMGLQSAGGVVMANEMHTVGTFWSLIISQGKVTITEEGALEGGVWLRGGASLRANNLAVSTPNLDCFKLDSGSTADLLGLATCKTGMKGVVARTGSTFETNSLSMQTGGTCIEASGGSTVSLAGQLGCNRATAAPGESTPLLLAESGAVVVGGAGTFANLTGSVGSGDCLAASANGVVGLESVHCENYQRLASADFGASVAVKSLSLITPPWASTDCVRQWHTGTVAAALAGPNAAQCEGLGVSSWCASGSNVSFAAPPTDPGAAEYSFLHSC